MSLLQGRADRRTVFGLWKHIDRSKQHGWFQDDEIVTVNPPLMCQSCTDVPYRLLALTTYDVIVGSQTQRSKSQRDKLISTAVLVLEQELTT